MRFRTAFTLLALSLMTAPLAALSPISGERVPLSNPPNWTNSGAWDGETLLFVDVLRRQVRKYDATGESRGDLKVGPKPEAFNAPTLIQGAGPGSRSAWIEYEDGYLVRANSHGKVLESVNLYNARGPQGKLLAVYWWTPLGPADLLVFGDLQQGEKATGAVVRVPIKEPSKFEVLRTVPTGTPAHRFFLVGQYLASVEGKPYFMIMEKVPFVEKPDGSGFRFVRLTQTGRVALTRPDVPARVPREEVKSFFQRLESSAIPVGLYGWKGFLYVLMRTPAEREETMWTLLKIEPATNEVLWNRLIESTANHLFAIPGEEHWAFVEKGPVRAPGDQEVRSFLRVKARDIEEP